MVSNLEQSDITARETEAKTCNVIKEMADIVTGVTMLRKSERKLLLNKLNGLEVNRNYLRAVKCRIKKRIIQAMRDLQLVYAVFPDLQSVTCVAAMRGVGFQTKYMGGTTLNIEV